jgi:hypothetical protein
VAVRLAIGCTVSAGLAALAVLSAQVLTEPRLKQAAKDQPRPTASLRVDTNLVLLPVAVCDPMNRPVMGLEKEFFRVFDDRV